MAACAPIGGFFGLQEPGPAVAPGRSVLDLWTGDAGGWLGFHNARSAFAWLVRALRPPTVWLPRYLCRDMRTAAGLQLRIYDVDERLDLADAALPAELSAGDLVVAVAYFGAPVGPALRSLAASRADVAWLEDRAQALLVDPADAVPGAWRLYSPRKLLGVHDGGVLVGEGLARLPTPSLGMPPPEHAEAARLRANDADRSTVEAAYRRYVEIERDHRTADLAMADETRAVLARTDPGPLAARRRANFAAVDTALADLAAPFVDTLRGCCSPFGYPIMVAEGRDALVARLAEAGLFCAVHWRELVEETPAASAARRLSESLVTLPVDHRYGEKEMARLIDGVRRALA